MKNKILILGILSMLMFSCDKKVENPFFAKWGTEFEVPNFDAIKFEHYEPAYRKGIAEHRADIEAIVNNSEAPTFENTILAYEKAGALLSKVEGVFSNLSSAEFTPEIKALEKKLTPELTALSDDIMLNAKLFGRIKAVHNKMNELNLDAESKMLLEKIYKSFERGGANLATEKQAEFRKINTRLAELSVEFNENVSNATNAFELYITDKKDLAGLPATSIEAAAADAESKGKKGQWRFTINKPSLIPFLQYAENRELREKMLKGYTEKCVKTFDNRKILSEMASLRVKRANLLGFDTHSAFILDKNMAKNPKRVYDFLDKIWTPAIKAAKAEAKELQKMVKKEGKNFKLQAWDWWYYTEKLRKEKYNLSEEEIKPYFSIDNVRDGAFMLVEKLWGIKFVERKDLPKYQKDVKIFELIDADGSHLGIFYSDYFNRPSKRGGAWMNSIVKQSGTGTAKPVDPIIMNVCNFTNPTASTPALLSIDEVQTLFHELGHAMHGFLSDCKYNYLSGTSTPRDFVELPSQLMENWALSPELLKTYAKHYKTGEVIPDELIAKIDKSAKFNQGFVTAEYMSAAYLDMDWHTLTSAEIQDADEFEAKSIKNMGLIDEIVVRYRSPYFRHVFAGGYSSGYYGYLWAAVLDADVFAAFQESGDLFNKDLAAKLRKTILSKGGTKDAMQMFVDFRGREPEVNAILKRKGFVK